jgi:DNA invertase Pin-like site-specific DNA recombinase
MVIFSHDAAQTCHFPLPKTFIGYARCSTDKQDLTAQREALAELGVAADRFHVYHKIDWNESGHARTESRACRCSQGDTLVVPKLDRLAPVGTRCALYRR